ncbi:methylenetetrahydrofolate reductase [Desulfovibrio oxyclinae]|uniref:methylenetetrahydrofolate reductase n=1 Tax=Desulfovibrio oxyclinae TaxID=63560 RepID=UPI00036911C6|nr:methylenetetrahydrofolate reductase [Desulfovibrio oxyclinae]
MLIHEACRNSCRTDGPFISLEFFPPRRPELMPKLLESADKLKTLKPLFAAVTCGAGGGGATGTLETAAKLSDTLGFTVMPHLTCVHHTPESAREAVRELKNMGIRNALAVRGDLPEGMDAAPEELRYATDLVAIIRQEAPDMAVGVAAYPDIHPESETAQQDVEMLKFKLDNAEFGVTQLFFDNRRYFDLVERLEGMGCTRPVIPGVLPIRSLGQIRRLMTLCSTPIPGDLLSSIEKAHAQGGDDAVRELGLDHAAQQLRDLAANGAPGIHLYPFNQAELCLELAQRAGLLS